LKEAVGALTGDENKRAEGRLDQNKGIAKEKKGTLKDLLKQPRQRSQKAPGKGSKPSELRFERGAGRLPCSRYGSPSWSPQGRFFSDTYKSLTSARLLRCSAR
jgi:uncharacterized protein YjbJ (UPF0337 family)